MLLTWFEVVLTANRFRTRYNQQSGIEPLDMLDKSSCLYNYLILHDSLHAYLDLSTSRHDEDVISSIEVRLDKDYEVHLKDEVNQYISKLPAGFVQLWKEYRKS